MTTQTFAHIAQIFASTDNIAILSMDCFDTLFWRQCHQPVDLFYTLAPTIRVKERIAAEEAARMRSIIKTGSREVTLSDIYTEIFRFSPELEQEQITSYIEQELQAEAQHGMIFEPAIELLRLAKQRGIKCLIVSDTYFSGPQLRDLLVRTRPELSELIDTIYCSSDWGRGKTEGIWQDILRQEGVKPTSIFHLGDNLLADEIAPRKAHIQGHGFRQFSTVVKENLQTRSIAAKLLDSDSETPSLFHDWYSSRASQALSRSEYIAWMSLGPILASFTAFIEHEVQKLGPDNTKLAFLLRDGFMPQQAYDALNTGTPSHQLRISRFTSIASSFTSTEKITDYLISAIGTVSLEMVFKQLQIPLQHQKTIKTKMLRSSVEKQQKTLIDAITSQDLSKIIIKNSNSLRKRLIAHIKKETNIKAGENLLLVDLGYTGTTVKLLGDLLENEMGIHLKACYLISSGDRHQKNRVCSLINPSRNQGEKTIACLLRFISALEMLCCTNDGSCLDYSETGEAILDKNHKNTHPDVEQEIELIQENSLTFIKENAKKIKTWSESEKNIATLSKSAAIDIAKYIYFPSKVEIDMLQSMKFDMNMGSTAVLELVNTDAAIATMRKQGPLASVLDTSLKQRMSYAAEMRNAGLEYSITLMSSYRNGMHYSASPLTNSYRRKDIEVLFVSQGQTHLQKIKSVATFDGYKLLSIPAAGDEVAILCGKSINTIEILEINKKNKEGTKILAENKEYFLSECRKISDRVFTTTENGLIYIPTKEQKTKSTINIIFREI